jgi:peptidoglycan/xylan/chitin deacetylase (PgdA/CDA1 family)
MTHHNGSAIVLCYHRIVEGADDPLSLSVHPDRFAEQVQRLPNVADVVPLDRIKRHGRERRQVAVTFDDAYADTAECAAPILESAGLPATVFVPTAALQPDHEFWWERLVHLVLDVAEPDQQAVEIELSGRPLRSDVRTSEGRLRTFHALNHRFLRLDPAAVDAAIGEIAAQLGGDIPRPCPRHRKLTSEQLRTLGVSGLFDVGGHSRTHALLAALDEDAQRDEVAGGRRELEALALQPVTSFAYPYGYAGSFDATTRALVREAGYDRACTTVADRVKRRTDPYRIPRYQVQDWNGDAFVTTVESWLAA